jgi:hypothetical protein
MLGINTLAGSNSAHHVYELRLYHVNGGKWAGVSSLALNRYCGEMVGG